MGERIAVAMSGGVDSSVAAWLLLQEGDDLIGVTLRLFDNEDAGLEADRPCCSLRDVEDARAVAVRLGIPHYVFNFSACFREQVMAPFAAEYEQGRTPNPCIECNRRVKFDALLRRLEQLERQAVATGHYARVERDGGTGRWLLKKAVHPEKDQSYVLYCLTQAQLARSRFPLGGMAKEEIRALAVEQGFLNARKRESQDICFVPDGDYAGFIRRFTGREYPPGPFVDEAGQVLGTHGGMIGYTVGQRRGLGVSSDQRLYVKAVRPQDNSVVLSGNSALYQTTLTAHGLNLIAAEQLSAPIRVRAKIRYRQQEQPATVEQTGQDTVRVTFDQPQRAVTPGQAVVFYDGDTVVGGATIQREKE